MHRNRNRLLSAILPNQEEQMNNRRRRRVALSFPRMREIYIVLDSLCVHSTRSHYLRRGFIKSNEHYSLHACTHAFTATYERTPETGYAIVFLLRRLAIVC